MPSQYLQGGDLAAYGVATATAQQVQAASLIVDSYLERPEGMVWSPDSNGAPCFMAGVAAQLSLQAPAGGIPAGSNVQVNFPTLAYMADVMGEVFILDSGTANLCEAVVVTAVNGSTVTFGTVLNTHAQGAPVENGRVILEERGLPSKRSVTRLSRGPIVRILSGLGRYAYGRRSDQISGLYNDTNLLAAIQTFGGPPQWIPWSVSQASVSVNTGEVWVPAGLLLAYYSEVRIRYVAGFPQAGLPSVIKQATANLVAKIIEYGDADPSFKTIQAGGTKLERFAQTQLSDDDKALLEPFRAKLNF